MSIKPYLISLLLVCLAVLTLQAPLPLVEGYRGLAQHHCQNYPLDLILRMSSGRLAEVYGPKYVDYDGYIRQYVATGMLVFLYPRLDNADNPLYESLEEQQQSDSEEEEADRKTTQKEDLPNIDPIVEEYVDGLKECGLHWTPEDLYRVWRFFRYAVQNDYLYEWLRTKMRISFGYEIQKPNAWMDGMQKQQRLRLQKLYSNDYLDDLETDFFREFLFPLMTAIRKNTVVAISGALTKSKKPALFNIIETRNFEPKVFSEVEIEFEGLNKRVMAFTVPGLPLLISGSVQNKASWAFSGILVDRTNVESIETTGLKYFHEETERWIKVKNITSTIKVKDSQDVSHHFYWCELGTFVKKGLAKHKIREFIVKWHEEELPIRNIFSKLHTLITTGSAPGNFQFPFNSIIYINQAGIHQTICPPEHSSYFIYPDLMGEPRNVKTLSASNPKRGFFITSNEHMSSINPDGYLDRQVFNSHQQALTDVIRRWKEQRMALPQALEAISSVSYDSNIRKLSDLFVFVYRKAKFTYFPDEAIRKECDQLVSMSDKWDFTFKNTSKYAAVFKLWLYFTKLYTFNHLTRSPLGKYLGRFRLTTDAYYANQIALWKDITSYGECDSHEYTAIEGTVNHTGHNCTCYYSIFRALNSTRLTLKEYGGLTKTDLDNFRDEVHWDLLNRELEANPGYESYSGNFSNVDLAFDNTYTKALVIASQLDGQVLYGSGNQPLSKWPTGSKEAVKRVQAKQDKGQTKKDEKNDKGNDEDEL